MKISPSPLRYPGGKAEVSNLLHDIMILNGLDEGDYYEPFAGGAGAALNLLIAGTVAHVYLNDADDRVYSFWKAVLTEPELFSQRIMDVSLTIEEWRRQHAICFDGGQHSAFDYGFAVFFLNRCNRSGILKGAGPIGGYAQSDKWRLDARFSRGNLSQRILRLKKYKESIFLSNKDALEFLVEYDNAINGNGKNIIYLDPPYYANGSRLYLNFYQDDDHEKLSLYVRAMQSCNWIMSYDDSQVIRDLYSDCQLFNMPLKYSLQNKRKAEELLIVPRHLRVPRYLKPSK